MSAQLPGGRSAEPRRAPVVLSEQTLRRICSEYIEMPGLRLTLKQAQRLWGLDEETCESSLSFLVDAKFLARVDDQVYARLTDGAVAMPPLRMAKVDSISPRRSSGSDGIRPRGLRPLVGRGGRGLP
jgi:hypothetical protein